MIVSRKQSDSPGAGRRVLPASPIPLNLHVFLRHDDNTNELFHFIANHIFLIQVENKIVMSTNATGLQHRSMTKLCFLHAHMK